MKRDIARLLNNGGEVPPCNLTAVMKDGQIFVSLPNLREWLDQMERAAVSDQKQEAYHGLRLFFDRFVMKEGAK